MKTRAVIISNGSIENYGLIRSKIKDSDYIICADGAIKHSLKLDLTPDLWIGDFDSCRYDNLIKSNTGLQSVPIIRLKPEKDETDTHIACLEAARMNFKKVLILGGTGKRCDHMLGNFALLEYLHKLGIEASVEDERNTIFFANKITKMKKSKKYISILPADEEIVIKNSEGLKYKITNLTLKRYQTMGISNEFISEDATIEFESGAAYIVLSDD